MIALTIWQSWHWWRQKNTHLVIITLCITVLVSLLSALAAPPTTAEWGIAGAAAALTILVVVLYPRYRGAQVTGMSFDR